MRTLSKWLAVVAATIVAGSPSADASFIGMPRQVGQMVKRISLSNYTLPPMAFTQFCLRYSDQCKPQPMSFRPGPVRLTVERWNDLKSVNARVNAAIAPERNYGGLANEKWLINPDSGDCNDFAVSKRAELLKRGWPAHALLLSEVVTNWGEGHLILVVRTLEGDLVLDNMSSQIRQWSKAPYRWVRMQSPKNPNFWASLRGRYA